MLIWDTLRDAVTITSFVAAMMILVEYLNVLTQGRWQAALAGSRWTQYVVAALLGATPGCLGAFLLVALYIHGAVSRGALVACMIATSGDEAFVMLAMFPGTAAAIMLGLSFLGLLAGMTTDLVIRRRSNIDAHHELQVHEDDESCRCFEPALVLSQLRHPTVERALLGIGLLLVVLALVLSSIGPADWNWVRITLLLTSIFALFVVLTVPQHFLKEHLYDHVVTRHMRPIFLWTLLALTVVAALEHQIHADQFVRENPWLMLGLASVLGIVPESGPHLLFVTLYDHGTTPLSVLVASSIVQDGHGMLPLFAHSIRDFMEVKAINLLVGITVGALLLLLGR